MKTLYLIKSNNYLKIGIAKDINNRLNHEDSVSKSNSKKRIKHVQKIIKDRKKLKEANTIHITKNGIRKTYY